MKDGGKQRMNVDREDLCQSLISRYILIVLESITCAMLLSYAAFIANRTAVGIIKSSICHSAHM